MVHGMSGIRRLDPILIDQIAAGEVIERPAAAVKELIENAVDARASSISVVIEQGGRGLIRVSDDGIGMSASDLRLAVERHATSKLPTDDLTRIATLGFRGEALPSIGAVSRLTITSRTQQDDVGTELRVDAGRIDGVRPAPMVRGTRVEVRDLFYATPARLKFLKGDRAEAQAVAQAMKRLAMAQPAVRFSLTGDGVSSIDLSAGTADEAGQLARLGQILGRDFRDNAVRILSARGPLAISGFASLPTYNRATPQEQYLFVNGRPVRDKLLLGAVRGAYHDMIASDRHPVIALFVEMDPADVDVNVHPAKAEVRFREPAAVRSLMVGALREALTMAGHRASTTLRADMLDSFTGNMTAPGAAYQRPSYLPRSPGTNGAMRGWAQPHGFGESAQAQFEGAERPAAPVMPQSETASTAHPLGAARAQLHGTYVLAETSDGFVLVDQHAAHERLVYERLKRQRAEAGVSRQILLIPEIVELSADDIASLLDHAAALTDLGLVVEPFGPGAVAIREVPASMVASGTGALVRDLAETLGSLGGPVMLEAAADLVLKTIACHHSVRAGRALKPDEMNALLREMEATPGAGQCNHGRPTYVELKLKDVERLFGRR
jgi:DNA mismatch repair protein MutL